jgi:uncharacterized membrane protein YkoI
MFKVIALSLAIAASAPLAGAQGTTTNKSAAKTTMQAGKTTRTHKKVIKSESQAALQREAKISEATARATALREVPNGSVKSGELERENGKLIYSFDITVPGKTGIDEVNIDATNGSVIAKQHETPMTEKQEAAKEAKEKKTAAKK